MRSDPKLITVYINEDMRSIIERWGKQDKLPQNYIFPILEPGMTPLKQYTNVQEMIRYAWIGILRL